MWNRREVFLDYNEKDTMKDEEKSLLVTMAAWRR
jgi:hypothetical protein